MAALLLPALMGVPGLIGGIMQAVQAGRQMAKGGRLRRRRVVKRKYGGRVKRRVVKRRGRGIAADMASSLPLIGPLAGQIVRAFGGRVKRRKVARRGRGLGYSGYVKPNRYGYGLPHTHIYQPIAVGAGLLGPGRYRPAIYGGLLSPTGGRIKYRKGHYKRCGGMVKYIRPTLIHRRKLLRY
jgi:hypothetical protein